jgi:CBS domain-containing protein
LLSIQLCGEKPIPLEVMSSKRCIMPAVTKPLLALTAGDLMTREVVRLPEEMPLREAARLLLRSHVGGAPVVDGQGKCVGVVSAVDFLRHAHRRGEVTRATAPPLPITCSFQVTHRRPDGSEVTLCTLPPGVCPIQAKQKGTSGEELPVCSQPHCVLVDWQVVDLEKLPTDEVRQFMTADPVMVQPDVSIRALARLMMDAHIHRIIVVDEQRRPIGIVSGTDLFAALAYAGPEQ